MSKPHLTKEFWLAGLRADGAAFHAAVAQDGALTADVPSCPGWTVEELVRHLGSLYDWVRGHVTRGVTTKPEPFRRADDAPTGTALPAWWRARYDELFATLDALDPGQPAWNPAPQAKRAGYWHRRMAHETALHRWDAQMAVGLAEPVEAKLAADGVTEVLDTMLPGGRRSGPVDRTGMVALHAVDVEQVWYVRVRGAGIALLDTDTLLDDQPQHERVVATGTASDLMLALWGRVPFDVLEVAGDAGVLSALRTG
jgi:uncharacterized protein (TIGR03083 family)